MEKIYSKYTHSNFLPIILTCWLIALCTIGCKKEWLEAKVDKKQAVPTTVKDFQAMLDYVNTLNRNSIVIKEVAADGHYYTVTFLDAIKFYYHHYNAYIWTKRIDDSHIPDDYSGPYRIILDMNIILSESENSKDQDKTGIQQVRAQALFHRARYFFDLAETFSPPYKASTANSDLGIALRLSTDITEQSKRSTLKQTYDQIIADLNAAKEVLPIVPQFLTRASKPAALGMLAKVYLAMGDYPNAFIYANEYLKIKNELLDYNTILPSASFIGVNKEVAFLNFLLEYSQITSEYLIDQSLYDSYDNNDLRKKVFFQTGAAGITFKGTYGNVQTDIFAGVATDEMYLIRAEGYARAGNFALAMKDLNDLLRTRWSKNADGTTKYVDQTATDETTALRKIFEERKKELILRSVRWSDLRRLNQDDRFKATLSRTVGGETFTLEPNSARYTFPIPQKIIEMSGMEQNLGW